MNWVISRTKINLKNENSLYNLKNENSLPIKWVVIKPHWRSPSSLALSTCRVCVYVCACQQLYIQGYLYIHSLKLEHLTPAPSPSSACFSRSCRPFPAARRRSSPSSRHRRPSAARTCGGTPRRWRRRLRRDEGRAIRVWENFVSIAAYVCDDGAVDTQCGWYNYQQLLIVF